MPKVSKVRVQILPILQREWGQAPKMNDDFWITVIILFKRFLTDDKHEKATRMWIFI